MDLIDFHTHILPGMDDGSADAETSVKMLQQLYRQGVTDVVLTPHFYPDRHNPQEFLQRRQASFARLQAAVNGFDGPLPRLHLGAEVYFYKGMGFSEELEGLKIGNSRYILVEMPMGKWSDSDIRELSRIHQNLDLTPIIAHLDRYLGPVRNYGRLQQLRGLPVLVQVNTGFFTHRQFRHKALKMLRQGQIHLLGTDCHNMTDRPPEMEEAIAIIEKKGPQDATQRLSGLARWILQGG